MKDKPIKNVILVPFKQGKYIFVTCPKCKADSVVFPSGTLTLCSNCGKTLVHSKYINEGEQIDNV